MKTLKLNFGDVFPDNYTGIVEVFSGTKEWWVEGKLHRTDGPAIEWGENITSCYIDEFVYTEEILDSLIKESIFLGIEKGKHGLEWIKLLTENGGICEIPNFKKLKESDIKKGII